MYKKYDGLIYPTEFLKKRYADCHFSTPEVVIGNGVDLAIFHPEERSKSEYCTLLYVGRIDPEKNLPIILESLHLLRSQHILPDNLRCIFVGG